MKCKCGNITEEVLVDLTRKADGKVAESVAAEFCEKCNAYAVDFGGVTFE